MKTLTGKPTLTGHECSEFSTKLLWYLGWGKETAILKKHLIIKLGLNPKSESDDRKLRLAVETLRQNKWPILSGDNGYFLCKTTEERDDFIAYHRKELITRCKMLCEVKKACNERLGKSVQIPMI